MFDDTILQEIFKVVLDLPSDADVESIRQVTTKRWDSLANVSMAAAIESEYGIRLDPADAERMTSYQAVRLLLEERSGG